MMVFPWDEEASKIADWVIFLAKLFWFLVVCEWAGHELRDKQKERKDVGLFSMPRDE
jgi:hypothetical protein